MAKPKYTTKNIIARCDLNTGKYVIKDNGEVIASGWGFLKYIATIIYLEENATKPIKEILK